jgi:hypothetical protein
MIELATTLTASKATTKAEQVRAYIAKNPKAKPAEIAKAVDTGLQYVYTVMWNAKKKTKAQQVKAKLAKASNWRQLDLSLSNNPLPIKMIEPKADPVNHPAHYKVGGIETIDFIEAKKLGYNLGNVVKYLTRADHKGNRLQDLRKAQWYLEREICNAEDNKKTK